MRSLPIQLWPLDCSITSSVLATSSPIFRAITSTSAAPTRLMPAAKLLTSLVRAPSPTRSLTRNTLLDSASISARWRSNTMGSQATIRLMLPSAARTGPPDMGASIVCRPNAMRSLANCSTSCGPSVGQSITAWPSCMACATPVGSPGLLPLPPLPPLPPNSTWRDCTASTTQRIVTTDFIAHSSILTWANAPNDAIFCILAASTS